ncbi:toll/interleukin-1 receptor domain-containing protein [Vibrio parahaemolyticus]|nr:toll/interleukin-1 receptor domain-containing protein [Vibrio parahaemolyticus]
MLKVFLSYCQKDDSYKNLVLSALAPLERSGKIKIWHDGELLVGDQFDSEITQQLQDSDIVIFLLSLDFVNSSYCREIETELAMAKYENEIDKMRIFPIMARKCVIDELPFQRFNMPFKMTPLKELDEDDVAVQLYDEMKKVVDKLQETNENRSSENVKKKSLVKQEFIEKRNELPIPLFSKDGKKLELADIFVYPDLKKKGSTTLDDAFLDTEAFFSECRHKGKKMFVIGSDQSGKTSLITRIFDDSLSKKLLPIIIDASAIKRTADLHKYVTTAFSQQYNDLTLMPKDEVVVLIDNFHKCPLNNKAKKILVDKLYENFETVLVFTYDRVRFEPKYADIFQNYGIYTIQDFGSKKLYEFIKNWVELDFDETADLRELNSHIDFYKRSLETVLGRNIVPSKPLYISIILQGLVSNHQPIDLTSHGHCYYLLITDALRKSKVPTGEISDYMNCLGELAWFMYQRNKNHLTIEEVDEFKAYYESEYYHSHSEEKITKIIQAGILVSTDEGERTLEFQYKYCYYYFVSKYIAEENDEIALPLIEKLSQEMHLEENSQILVFTIHHTKKQVILDKITSVCEKLFREITEATLSVSELEGLEKFAKNLPELAGVHDDDFEERRKEIYAERDREEKREILEQHNREQQHLDLLDDGMDNDSEQPMIDIEEDPTLSMQYSDEFLQIQKSMSAVKLLGQVVKQRKGSLKQRQITPLAAECYNVGLRTLKFTLTKMTENEEQLLESIEELIAEHQDWTEQQCAEQAQNYYITMCFFVTLSVIKLIAASVGQRDYSQMYETITKQLDSSAAKLVEILIELEFNKKLPKNLIKELFIQHNSSSMVRRVLQECLIDHVNLNHVESDDKTWIFKTLDIPDAKLALEVKKLRNKTPQYRIRTKGTNKTS